MNFLLRTHPVVSDPPNAPEVPSEKPSIPKMGTTLEGLIAKESLQESSISGIDLPSSTKIEVFGASHLDVSEDEGWITIPQENLPENWFDAPDILSFKALDRPFVFPGEQLHVLVCLSGHEKKKGITTSSKTSQVFNRNGILHKNYEEFIKTNEEESNSCSEINDKNSTCDDFARENCDFDESVIKGDDLDGKIHDISSGNLLLQEECETNTKELLERFQRSHFFVRIASGEEPLWSKKNGIETSTVTQTEGKWATVNDIGIIKTQKSDLINTVIDNGNFDASLSGGIGRNVVRCCSLSNGDIVVLIQVTVGTAFPDDPVLEVFQFEKPIVNTSNNQANAIDKSGSCDELLKWVLPLDLPLPSRSISPPLLGPTPNIGSVSQRSNYATPSTQLFSFGNFRSYSMSSLPQTTSLPFPTSLINTRSSFELEDWDRYMSQKNLMNQESGKEQLLSFRGVSLEPERFSVQCGLEGIYVPGRRWRRKLEIIQPLEINTFVADCNSEDLICVQIRNISPVHMPDIRVYVDAISIIFDEASKTRPPFSLPIACIEVGDENNLPNLSLRRDEEHSFILKPTTSLWKDPKTDGYKGFQQAMSQVGNVSASINSSTKMDEVKNDSSSHQYAVLVSCRCNYTDSRLFFRKGINWHPRIPRDLMISVTSKISDQGIRPNGRISQLPIQVLTLQASNLTAEDLTLTVLALASFTPPPTVVSLNSAPSTPLSPFAGFSDFVERVGDEKRRNRTSAMQRLSSVPLVNENAKENDNEGMGSISLEKVLSSSSEVVSSTDLGCTHLWLQRTVPLGLVPSQSTATVKLELLPLTDGIITLDSLQISAKEKGVTYVPERALKIHSTSSIATGIL